VLAKGRSIIPVIGARTRAQLDESLGALAIQLSASELAEIEQTNPAAEVAGDRYGAPQMKHLDSER
jgi:aryl-alcohol dehydrogenase-like predicted oxidoreductase